MTLTDSRCPHTDYSADVYARVAEMFAANVFRPLSPSSYTETDDETAASCWGAGPTVVISEPTIDETVEFTQTIVVYQVFQVFVERELFNADMVQPHVHRRFVNGLMQRLNSANAAERITVRDIAERIWVTCPAAQQTVFRAAIDELADFAYGYVPRHNGVNELLDFFSGTAGTAAVPKVTYRHPFLAPRVGQTTGALLPPYNAPGCAKSHKSRVRDLEHSQSSK